jgi:hypothetical protein
MSIRSQLEIQPSSVSPHGGRGGTGPLSFADTIRCAADGCSVILSLRPAVCAWLLFNPSCSHESPIEGAPGKLSDASVAGEIAPESEFAGGESNASSPFVASGPEAAAAATGTPTGSPDAASKERADRAASADALREYERTTLRPGDTQRFQAYPDGAEAEAMPVASGGDGSAENKAPEATTPGTAGPSPAGHDADWPADCETRHVFKAHGAAKSGDPSKYTVAGGAEYVMLFYFTAPWSGDVQLLQSHAVVDNPKLVHHWALYALDNPQAEDGEIMGSAEQGFSTLGHAGMQLVVTGGPGASALTLPDDVGLRLPTGNNLAFAFELHYFNPSDASEEDATGIELCVTHAKRPIEAATHVLGRVTFEVPAHSRQDVISTCNPNGLKVPVHLVSVTPHMHRTGVKGTLALRRKSGETVMLIDEPYSFLEQRTYALPKDRSSTDVILEPGDTLTSTCGYENNTDATVSWGDRTEDEMCGMQLLAWPAGVLNNGLPLGTLFATANDVSCLEF